VVTLPDLSGTALGRYRLDRPLGRGGTSVVYRATERPGGKQVAIKVLDPQLARHPRLLTRLVEEAGTVSRLGHPAILPVYEVARRGELAFVSMRLAQGGTLEECLRHRTFTLGEAVRVARDLADALHRAHEAGVIHQNLKPSNLLFDGDGSVLVADFGLAPWRYGLPLRPSPYVAPEQVQGKAADRRTDVYALGRLLLTMVAGSRVPELSPARSGAGSGPAEIGRIGLPEGLGQLLASVLSEDPAARPQTMQEFRHRLEQVLPGWVGESWTSGQLPAFLESSPDAVLTIDAEGRIRRCNRRAESVFGWPCELLVGRPVLSTLISPRHRELFERLLAASLAGHLVATTNQPAEIVALRRDGRQVTVEISLSRLQLGDDEPFSVAFCHDVSAARELDLLAEREPSGEVTSEVEVPEAVVPAALEAVCGSLGWTAGALWFPSQSRGGLCCRAYWARPWLSTAELGALYDGSCAAGEGVVGRCWMAGERVWCPDLSEVGETARERTAARLGLRAVAAFPIREGAEVVGVLECFSSVSGPPDLRTLAEVEAVAYRLGELARRSSTVQKPRLRYRVDPRNSHLGFSCAFMKFLTVHGRFRDFSGWVEIVGNDPTTAQAECTIKTASVDTGSLDRDYHLCSADFFDTDRYPDMVFRSTGVEALGDERFRVSGELTIRSVTRPLRLDVRLEDHDIDASGTERVTLTALTVIDRTEWFLDWERALQAGRWIVGNEVRLELVVTLVRRPWRLPDAV
jgi:PAS domain S-box-containing protein